MLQESCIFYTATSFPNLLPRTRGIEKSLYHSRFAWFEGSWIIGVRAGAPQSEDLVPPRILLLTHPPPHVRKCALPTVGWWLWCPGTDDKRLQRNSAASLQAATLIRALRHTEWASWLHLMERLHQLCATPFGWNGSQLCVRYNASGCL